jgi:hypothetical protein
MPPARRATCIWYVVAHHATKRLLLYSSADVRKGIPVYGGTGAFVGEVDRVAVEGASVALTRGPVRAVQLAVEQIEWVGRHVHAHL